MAKTVSGRNNVWIKQEHHVMIRKIQGIMQFENPEQRVTLTEILDDLLESGMQNHHLHNVLNGKIPAVDEVAQQTEQ